MNSRVPQRTWFGTYDSVSTPESDDTRELARTWQGFIAARFTLGTVLLVLQTALFAGGIVNDKRLVFICLAYFASTLPWGLRWKPGTLGTTFNRPWIRLVGVDLVAFTSLQYLQGSNINYTPLFALPILLASVLGSLQLALGTAAGATVVLLASTLSVHLKADATATPQLVQAALSGVGYFAVAFLANQLATRLVSEGRRARQNHLAALMQRQVNALVMESLPDGVLVVDSEGQVRAANPAAQDLLSRHGVPKTALRDLKDRAELAPLLQMTRLSIGTGRGQEESITILLEGSGQVRLRVRSRLTSPDHLEGEILCVLFLQDQHELEARMRTERLASMGRMSTAVAHEIRNPLSAITQANALLDEELTQAGQKRLTEMVKQNALRLSRIVEDILDAARVPAGVGNAHLAPLNLELAVQRICHDWTGQHHGESRLSLQLSGSALSVRFDGEHLRRVLINLLDNAMRYASADPQSIQVSTEMMSAQRARLSVWSDGAPLEPSVERHLFEPFFSSESRSNGLGLYICRELCEGHRASIAYRRRTCTVNASAKEGNAFEITFERLDGMDATANGQTALIP